jgi:propanediol dehydratase large subunit
LGSDRAAKRSVARCAPEEVIALAVGGQLGFCSIISTCL